MAARPMAPPITPPTASILPAPLLLVDEGVVDVLVAVPVLDEVAAADELVAIALTSEGWRVPQFTQAWEPGLSRRHCLKVA